MIWESGFVKVAVLRITMFIDTALDVLCNKFTQAHVLHMIRSLRIECVSEVSFENSVESGFSPAFQQGQSTSFFSGVTEIPLDSLFSHK